MNEQEPNNEAKDPYLKNKEELIGKELKVLDIQHVDAPSRPFSIYICMDTQIGEEVHFYGSSVMDKIPVQKDDKVEIESKISEAGRKYYYFVKLKYVGEKNEKDMS